MVIWYLQCLVGPRIYIFCSNFEQFKFCSDVEVFPKFCSYPE